MTLLTFFGCALTAYGPALSIFFLQVAKDAQLVLLMVSSAFFWLISIFLASIIWIIIKPLKDNNFFTIFYSVLLQELFRLGFFIILKRAEHGLHLVSKKPDSPYNKYSFAFVCGLGYGLISGSITFVTLLVYSVGPAVTMCKSCSFLSLYFVGAITTCLFILLHITWMITAFEGFRSPKKNFFYILFTLLSHLGASYATLLNESTVNLGCIYSLMINLILLISSVLIISATLKKARKT